jgi:hypothetical protein
MKRYIWFIIGVILAVLIVVTYSRLSESQKRYLAHLGRQIPYLPGRYMA